MLYYFWKICFIVICLVAPLSFCLTLFIKLVVFSTCCLYSLELLVLFALGWSKLNNGRKTINYTLIQCTLTKHWRNTEQFNLIDCINTEQFKTAYILNSQTLTQCTLGIFWQEHFQEFPVHMAMLICSALKEEKKILNMAIKTEVWAPSTTLKVSLF